MSPTAAASSSTRSHKLACCNTARNSARITSRASLVLCLLAAPLLLPASVLAATANTTFNISATVSTSCSVTASDLAFGAYDPASATDTTATSTLSVTCSLLTPYTISLDSGAHAAGSTRRMGSGASRLSYEVYRDVTMTGVFGTVASLLGVSGTGTGFTVQRTLYGKIPKNQAVAPGSYSDQITVTVDY